MQSTIQMSTTSSRMISPQGMPMARPITSCSGGPPVVPVVATLSPAEKRRLNETQNNDVNLPSIACLCTEYTVLSPSLFTFR